MSFNLPRNQKDLRFTGELRAAIEDHPRGTLGIPRSKKTPQPGRSALSPDVYKAEPIPTPFAPPPIEPLDWSDDDDDSPTTMLDRDGLDVLPGGFRGPQPKTERNRRTPVPNFRTPPAMPSVIVAPDAPPRARPAAALPPEPKTPPLVVWLVAALVLAIVSYRVVPAAVAKADLMVKRASSSM